MDELHSAKTSYIGKKPQLNDSVPMRGAGLGAGPPVGLGAGAGAVGVDGGHAY